jgi:carbonic anhydrase
MRRMAPLFHRSHFLAVLLLMFALPYALGAHSQRSGDNPVDPLSKLKLGNQEFSSNEHFKQERKRVYGQAKQTPFAIVLSCSDSRVPPEIVFGKWLSLGDLFVIRVAGNVVDPTALGSIEYAAKVLHAKLLFVLGHERCGAVEAARAQNPLDPNIAWFVAPIQLAVERTRGREEIETIKENVRVQIENVRKQSSIIRDLEEKEGFKIAGGVFYLNEKANGRVEFFPDGR